MLVILFWFFFSGVLTDQPVEDESSDMFLWDGEVFSGVQDEAEDNDVQQPFCP